MSARDLETRLELALAAAREAGRLTLRSFQRDDLQVEWKADATPVTVADRAAEQLLRDRIAAAFGQDGVLGEEAGETPGRSGYRWILDPIDGTKSFVRGVPLYGTLVAVERDGRSVLGVIYLPALDECVYAATGMGAWHETSGGVRRAARVSSRSRLAEALVCTSDFGSFAQVGRQAALDRLLASGCLLRTWGDCYGYLLVATGRADAMIDPAMSLWDAATLQPILEEAGGAFVDWRGNPTTHSGEGIGTNAALREAVLAAVQDI